MKLLLLAFFFRRFLFTGHRFSPPFCLRVPQETSRWRWKMWLSYPDRKCFRPESRSSCSVGPQNFSGTPFHAQSRRALTFFLNRSANNASNKISNSQNENFDSKSGKKIGKPHGTQELLIRRSSLSCLERVIDPHHDDDRDDLRTGYSRASLELTHQTCRTCARWPA